ncbi:MAG TPA: glycosyltransferase family 2 protein [Patescibacteria group bacterium]|nr:glycosyltransferase family 2 protein [Patescibacteria group bacterium]
MIPTASIIIPNWNGLQHLETCLAALMKQTTSDIEVIVVDNGSNDGSTPYIRQNFPTILLVELGENRGFTGACNAGYTVARGKYIILLNNDTEVDPEWLGQLLGAFDRHPDAGILASKIMLFDRRDYFHAAGDFYRLDAIPGNRGVWQKDTGQFDTEEQVFSACGAAAAYRRDMLDEIGFLDDRFYFSCEDIDLGWRAHMAGWKAIYVPTAVVYHKLKATGGSITGSYFDGRNFLYLIWKNYPWPLLIRYWPAIFKAQLQISWLALHAWRGPASRARLRGQLAGLLGLFRMLPARKRVQANRRITDENLTSLLTPVDDVP